MIVKHVQSTPLLVEAKMEELTKGGNGKRKFGAVTKLGPIQVPSKTKLTTRTLQRITFDNKFSHLIKKEKRSQPDKRIERGSGIQCNCSRMFQREAIGETFGTETTEEGYK
jgi:hypothetical protein